MQSVYPSFIERYRDRLEPSTYRLVERFVHDTGTYFHRELPHRTVVHGDFRLDNLLFRNGGVGVVDFQTVTHACGVQDLAYFLGAGLSVEDRRKHERDLVQRWVDGLSGYGVTVAFDAVWAEYRAFAFAGVVMAVVASMIVQRTGRGDDMFMTMAHRHAQHAIDLDSLDVVQN
jgi:aminoglycoside phosphotransferase (APT) family kinase protein